jgi:3-oxoacyl-[acyl-carrier-protein] synthase-1
MVLTTDGENLPIMPVTIAGASVTNDANHISGPSRTGEELALAISRALAEATLPPAGIDYINAHGTATPFNDEMESKAFALAGLSGIPVNSLKGYWGHTLGAAGIIESVITARSMIDNILVRSAGFESLGVPEPLNIITATERKEVNTALKTASGFGGCNAAVVFQKG